MIRTGLLRFGLLAKMCVWPGHVVLRPVIVGVVLELLGEFIERVQLVALRLYIVRPVALAEHGQHLWECRAEVEVA